MIETDYQRFLDSKRVVVEPSGFEPTGINPLLFDFQRDIVRWALMKGKAAIFAGTGLGKTIVQLEWAKHVYQHTGGNILILAPLAVAQQTSQEGLKFGIKVKLCRRQEDIEPGINVTNYEMLHNFDTSLFEGVILDESSILKAFDGKVRNEIINCFKSTPYKLACTATPAPNDHMELGNHAEFLQVMSRAEMLSMFFVHDGGETSKWRLKGHARKSFWEWVASWAVMMSKPSDLGYEDGKFLLPSLNITQIVVKPENSSFSGEAQTLQDRRRARSESMVERVSKCREIIGSSEDPWIVWCDLNSESEALTSIIPGAIEIKGSHSREYKEQTMMDFSGGRAKKLVTKPMIAGFGMNWQHCCNMIFVGLSDSFEQYFQAVRRCWRFGQTREVNVYVITAEAEGSVVKNIQRKEAEFQEMLGGMISATQEITKKNIKQTEREESPYMTDIREGPGWIMALGDNVETSSSLEENSIDYIVFSPPFSQLYTYSNSERDMGNCKNDKEFYSHFGFLVKELHRILKPGRLVSFHCMDLPSMKERDGVIGLKDFPGLLIKIFQDAGFIYHSRVTIWKNPASEMQRTKALGLLHKQLKKDSSMCRMGIPDYVITMRKPGENQERITHTNESYPVDKWREVASPIWETQEDGSEMGISIASEFQNFLFDCWFDITQSKTLQKKNARESNDEKHIAPLQLDVIEKCLELWTNPGDLVYDPFAGIGSTLYQARLMGRIAFGCELKESYWREACKNLDNLSKVDIAMNESTMPVEA